MMRLFKVELTRFRSRRFNQVVVLGTVVVALVLLFGAWQSSKPASAEELGYFNSSVQDWEKNGDRYIADCLADEAEDREVNPDADWGCETISAPVLENYTSRSATFADDAANVLPSFALVLVLGAFAMGVSFLSAEFSSGAIGNWLTFEPRRGRVYGTKVSASGISVIPISLGVGALVIAGFWLVNSLNDNVGAVTGETWRAMGESGLRVLLATTVFAVFGAALGTIVRHTAAALGIVLGYVIVVEGIIGGLFETVRPWLLQLNLTAVLNDGASYGTNVCVNGPSGQDCQWIEKTVSLGQGATVIGAVVFVAIAVAALVFRRRDVN